jgi:hypothetical protein
MNLLRGFIVTVLFFSVCGSGCTKIDTPVRDTSSGEAKHDIFTLVVETTEILDTQPLIVTAVGGSGTILWSCDAGSFQPNIGDEVLFIPHDSVKNELAEITAEDEKGHTASLTLRITDEGPPPQPGDVLLNEIAWAGTLTSSYDEYIEIINRTSRPFYLLNWRIENGAGAGTPLTFSGRIEAASPFLIANYNSISEKTALTCKVQCTTASLSLSNSSLGPLVLTSTDSTVFDTVGTGGKPAIGLNTSETRSSMSRYTDSNGTAWDQTSWYTSGEAVNLNDGTFGSPGAPNTDTPFSQPHDGDALGIITEYSIDAHDDLGEDWVELFITESGSIKNFVITDLDGDDTSITSRTDVQVIMGEYILVVWNDRYTIHYQEDNRFYTPDSNPTGTKDQIVLMVNGVFIDGVCYFSDDSTGDDRFGGDKDIMTAAGWNGDPIFGKHASRITDSDGAYVVELTADGWDTEIEPSPGS